MGTKRKIAQSVAQIVDSHSRGPFLDLFAGMCAVSTAIGYSRAVWCNDVQTFAATVASAFFTSGALSKDSRQVASVVRYHFRENCDQLCSRFSSELAEEKIALASLDVDRIRSLERSFPNIVADDVLARERATLAREPYKTPYRLFSITFSGGYFSLAQSIEIDSIRFAIDQAKVTNEINAIDHRWLCLGLCQVLSKVATTTGHFAQHLRANNHNCARFVAQRCRSVWTEWLSAISDNQPMGTGSWRAQNKVFQQDAISLLNNLKNESVRPAVVYADPPYSRDQYSRYYHVYETLLKYDYPVSEGSGRYRSDRFRSPFCLKTRVEQAIQSVILGCAKLGAALILSYPERGMLSSSTTLIPSLIRQHYGRQPVEHSIVTSHSSFGASKGQQYYPVRERIYSVQ